MRPTSNPTPLNVPRTLCGRPVVETLASSSGFHLALITQDPPGHFHVHRLHWCTEDLPLSGQAFWEPDDSSAVITDTIEQARCLARELLFLREGRPG
jgi:hypothetical protein